MTERKKDEIGNIGLEELSNRYIETRKDLDKTEKEIKRLTEDLDKKRSDLKSKLENIRDRITSYHQGVEENIDTQYGDLQFRFSHALKIKDREKLLDILAERGHISEGVRIRKNFVRDLIENDEIEEDLATLEKREQVTVREKVELTNEEEEELYEVLRAKRNEMADEEGLDRFYVFSNQALKRMATQKPTDEEEMMDLKGVGEKNLEKYGESFLDLIRDFMGVEDLMLDDEEEELFESLKERRKERAEDEDVPPYIVFHDSTLKRLSKERPVTREDILDIKGVGEKKYEKYGEDFLQEIEEFCD